MRDGRIVSYYWPCEGHSWNFHGDKSLPHKSPKQLVTLIFLAFTTSSFSSITESGHFLD